MAVDVDDVEADGLDPSALLGQPLPGQAPDAILLLGTDCEDASSESLIGAGLHFDEGSHLGPTMTEQHGDEVEFTGLAAPIALDDGEAVLLVPTGCEIFPEPAEGLIVSCHDDRAGRTASSESLGTKDGARL